MAFPETVVSPNAAGQCPAARATAPRPPARAGRGGGNDIGKAVARATALLALLYLFLVAIALLGTAFTHFGERFSASLIRTTAHPVIGLMLGLLATSLLQSSSSTTSIVVGMVAAGALTTGGAIPIIMGANLGTTVTNTLVALGYASRRAEFRRAFAGATMHDFFNLMTILILFPLEQATHYLERTATWLALHLAGAQGVQFHSPLKSAVAPALRAVESAVAAAGLPEWLAGVIELALALGGIFGALALLTRLMRRLVLRRAEGTFARTIRRSGLLGMLLGALITVAVQSSSVTTSLLVPLIGAGLLPLEAAFPVTLGANLGTTVTALLASLTGNLAAVIVALVHLLFNATGILIIYPLQFLRRVPVRLSRRLALAAVRRRRLAIAYLLGVFFVLPMFCVLVTELL